MKKTIVMTIILSILLSLVTVVNAAQNITASLSGEATQNGKRVSVVITFDKEIGGATFVLKHNDTIKYKSGALLGTAVTDGTRVDFVEPNGTTEIELTFDVIKDGAKDVTIGFSPVEVIALDYSAYTVSGSVADVKVVLLEETEKPDPKPEEPSKPGETEKPGTTPEEPSKPGETEKPGTTPEEPSKPGETEKPGTTPEEPSKPNETEKPSTTPDNTNKPSETKPGTSGEVTEKEEKPKKYDQTGVNMLEIASYVAGIVVLMVAGTIAIKKYQK